jgi:sulfate adenylyltransferase subunit 2
MREVAGQCANPVLLFSGGKDSICMLRIAEKAFRPGRFPFPLMHIDTGHNYKEVTDFRDKRAAELGERLIVRSVEDSMARGTVVLKSRRRIAQQAPVGDAARSDRGIRLRRLHRRRPPRRGKGARQGAHLFLPRRVRPVGPEEPAPRAVGPVQRAQLQGREHPRLPDLELDRVRRLAVHRARKARTAVDLLRPHPPGRAPQRRPAAGDRHHPGPEAKVEDLQVRFRTVGDITCTAPVESDADTVEKIIAETATTTITERGATRLDDQTSEASMEQRKKEGLFLMSARKVEKFPPLKDNGLLRFLTCGSVDDGKSTLIGRLLYDTKTILADTLHAIERTSKKRGWKPSTCRCSPTACRPSANRASPSTSPTATSPPARASTSSPTRRATSSTRATWSPPPRPPISPSS